MGFGMEYFTEKVDENLKCAICHDVFENPLTCKDGHTFCSECIENWLKEKKTCPADSTKLNKKALVRNLTVKGIIDNLEVYCDPMYAQESKSKPAKRMKTENSEEQSCSWIGQLQELLTHQKTCDFQLVTCSHDNCKQKIKRKELEKHKETCDYRTVVCVECEDVMVVSKLQKHLEKDCPFVMIPCKCSTDGEVTKIRRLDMAKHLSDVCPKGRINCPYKEHGCKVKVERQDVDKHVQENMAAHMMLLAKECSLLKKQNKSLTDQCSTLVHKNIQLNKDLEKVEERETAIETEFCNEILSSRTYTWTVTDYPNLSETHPKDSSVQSPTFWLCGSAFCLLLYPNGDQSEDATGFLSLFVEKVKNGSRNNTIPSNEEIAFRLTIISQTHNAQHVSRKTKHHVFNNSWGWKRFMKTSDALSPAYCNNGKLTIQCTIFPTATLPVVVV